MSEPLIVSKMKCPVCGAKLNAGSDRYIEMTPFPTTQEWAEHNSYTEYFFIQIFYCTKDDAHNFGILRRDWKRTESPATTKEREEA